MEHDRPPESTKTIVVKGVVSLVLLAAALVVGFVFDSFPGGFALFVVAVFSAPRDAFRGLAGSQDSAGPSI